jgi:hypothetical protein
MNQVEIWFSILQSRSLSEGSFTSPGQLHKYMDNFIAAYNKTQYPFEWKKQVVFQNIPKTELAGTTAVSSVLRTTVVAMVPPSPFELI